MGIRKRIVRIRSNIDKILIVNIATIMEIADKIVNIKAKSVNKIAMVIAIPNINIIINIKEKIKQAINRNIFLITNLKSFPQPFKTPILLNIIIGIVKFLKTELRKMKGKLIRKIQNINEDTFESILMKSRLNFDMFDFIFIAKRKMKKER